MLNFSKIDGRYSILRQLYRRGVTEAYLARDERAEGREVVLEVTSHQAPAHRSEFETAVGLLQAIDHPNVVPVLELLVDAPYVCVVKSWEPGMLLEEWLRDPAGGLEAQQSLRISLCRDILEGLAAVHNTGLLHRDLRPRNIWLSEGSTRPTAQLDHFDQATLSTGGESLAEPVGDPLRRPPEVLRNQNYSKQSDVYAAGLTLFELLSEGESIDSPESQDGEFGAWGQLEEETIRRCVPLPYSHVVARATHRFRVERFEGGLDLLAAFDGMDLERRLREAGLD